MTMINIITAVIFAMGLLTVILSAMVACKFKRYNKGSTGGARGLSGAIAWQLFGEAIMGVGTLMFAAAAAFGYLSSWSTELQSTIRFVMFLATSWTTYNLLKTLKDINE